jgi:hypothetical protein
MPKPTCIAVYDSTLAGGRALACEAARMGVPAFALGAPSGDDIGMLWHAQLARLFATFSIIRSVAKLSATLNEGKRV